MQLKCVYSMSNYVITKYSFNKAQQLDFVIKPLKYKNQIIDVYEDNIFLGSIGI